MVSSTRPYNSSSVRAGPGEGFDGVVRVRTDENRAGTGVLLGDGRTVLTAAHLLESVDADGTSIHFNTLAGDTTLDVDSIVVHPDYDPDNAVNDLALVWLEDPAPTDAERYALYRDEDEVGQTFSLVGFGKPATGAYGVESDTEADGVRRSAENRIDALPGTIEETLGRLLAWTPDPDGQFLADFDDGTAARDALGLLAGIEDRGVDDDREGLITQGDSGGPAFLDDRVVGIATLIVSIGTDEIQPDADAEANSSFGEVAFWQRISHHQDWIDTTMRAHDAETAPAVPDDVALSIAEGDEDDGTTLVWFLVSVSGDRSDPDDETRLTVEYTTRDGTAEAGEDYIATSGRLVLYPGEDHAAIPVEILGDDVVEEDEVFYLDITSPVGAGFADDVPVLSAARTILDDDGTDMA